MLSDQGRYPFSVMLTVCQEFPLTAKFAGVVSHCTASMQTGANDGVEKTVILPGVTAPAGTIRRKRSTRSTAPVTVLECIQRK